MERFAGILDKSRYIDFFPIFTFFRTFSHRGQQYYNTHLISTFKVTNLSALNGL